MSRRLFLLLLVFYGRAWAQEHQAPNVVVSILPIHSLVAGIMDGVGEPALLVPGGQSPHHYSLRPSAARALRQAQLVVWVGPEIEGFLARSLDRAQATVLTLLDSREILLLPAGETSARSDSEHRHQGQRDGHIWLDPRNAKVIVELAARALAEIDPANRARYRENELNMTARLNELDTLMEGRLAPIRTRPFLVFHDSYRYLVHRYGLNLVASVTLDPDRQPGARRVLEIREQIRTAGARCVFSGPQFQSRLVDTLIAGSAARGGVLDPLGAGITPGPDAYFDLMHTLGRQLTGCLAPENDEPG